MREWRPSEGTQSGPEIQTPFSLLDWQSEQAKPNSWKRCWRQRKEGGEIESVLGRNQFQHESDTASHHISSDIDWRGCAYEYSTENCPSWNARTGHLQMWGNSPPTSGVSRLYCLSCHADIKGNFLCLCCLRQSLLFSVTKCHLFFLFNLQNIQKISHEDVDNFKMYCNGSYLGFPVFPFSRSINLSVSGYSVRIIMLQLVCEKQGRWGSNQANTNKRAKIQNCKNTLQKKQHMERRQRHNELPQT